MIVVDASVIIDLLLRNDPQPIEAALSKQRFWLAPELLDVEVGNVLKRAMLAKAITKARATEAFDDYQSLPLRLHAHRPLLLTAWSLSASATFYDAAYLALARVHGARLVTRDMKLYRAHRREVDMLTV